MSQSTFVSSIPNNKLEPVFVGGGSGPKAKSSGTYVPAFLRDKESHTTKQEHTVAKEFKMADDDFPSLLGSTKSTKKTTDTPKTVTDYSNALKKDIDKPRPKITNPRTYNEPRGKKKKTQPILDDSSGEEYIDYVPGWD